MKNMAQQSTPLFSNESYPEKFCNGGAPTMREAFERCKADGGVVVAANGSWYRVIEGGEERVKRADFEFLVVMDGGRPFEFTATFSSEDGNKWTTEKKDLTEELETMEEEAKVANGIADRLVDDLKAISAIGDKLTLLAKKAPHVRLTMLSFSLLDEEFEVPAWRVEVKNWPIISYLDNNSKERSRVAKAVVDALSGKVLSYKEA